MGNSADFHSRLPSSRPKATTCLPSKKYTLPRDVLSVLGATQSKVLDHSSLPSFTSQHMTCLLRTIQRPPG